MSNVTSVAPDAPGSPGSPDDHHITNAERYIWIVGIALSAACVAAQIIFLILLPKIRKLDQKILIQLSVARFVYTLVEYLLTDEAYAYKAKDVVFALYGQTDAVLICWMFVYTKNLYDKIVQVFALQKFNFLLLSVLIWVLTIPLGVMTPLFLSTWPRHYETFYKTYGVIKFIVLFVNVLFFCNIFWVIYNRNRAITRQFTDVVKTCVISFILVNITCLQILLTDLSSFFIDDLNLSKYFCLVNAYQVVAIMLIFIILTRKLR